MDDVEQSVAPHVRRLRQRALSNRLRESLLFLPLVLLIGGVVLQELARLVDENFSLGWLRTFDMSPDAAATLLSTIAGATITTAGVVFSLLVVSLQLASGQFSPRVLRTFWRDRVGQLLIGLLLATFAFCVLALSQLDTSAAHAPTVTMALATCLALASILAIVGYLNRITRQQYVGKIMERIQQEALALIEDLPYGSRMGGRCGATVPVPDTTDHGPGTRRGVARGRLGPTDQPESGAGRGAGRKRRAAGDPGRRLHRPRRAARPALAEARPDGWPWRPRD